MKNYILIAVLAVVAMAAGWLMSQTHAQVVASVQPPPGLSTTIKFYNDTSEVWEGILSDDPAQTQYLFQPHQLTVVQVPFVEGQFFLFGPLNGGVPFQVNDALVDNNNVHFCFGTTTPDTGYVGRAFSYENTGLKPEQQ